MAGTAIALSSGSAAASGRSSMTRGRLEMFAATPATDGQGGVKRGAGKGAIEFQFNPKEMSIAKSAKWESKPAARAGGAAP